MFHIDTVEGMIERKKERKDERKDEKETGERREESKKNPCVRKNRKYYASANYTTYGERERETNEEPFYSTYRT